MDSSESVSAEAYGQFHMTYPLRNLAGLTVAIIDLGIAREQKNLPEVEKRNILKIFTVCSEQYNEPFKVTR